MDAVAETVQRGGRKMSEWILVSDRLPRTNIDVLVTADNGEIYIASKEPDDTFYFYEKLYDEDTQAIAWMPLPKPYREEGER